uniref:2b protein n=1 Tax=Peanut stunt virus TaxID=12313 RepID=A0A2Z6E1T1_9BROM|nr:2b protein [Peanut stunt virus]
MSSVEQIHMKLQKLVEKQKSARRRHRQNRKARGHKSPSELRRRELRETLFLLSQLPLGLLHDEDNTCCEPSCSPSYTSCDETDWFAGNEWCEGSYS